MNLPVPDGAGHAHGLAVGKHLGVTAQRGQASLEPILNDLVWRALKPAVQALAGGILSGYSSSILKGQPVKYNPSNGQIIPVSSTENFSGAFAGVEWTDTTGRRRVSNYWPASTSGTNIIAYFYQDQQIVYEIQTDGTLAQTAIGSQFDITNPYAGSTTTGLSAATMSNSGTTSGNNTLRVIDIAPYPDNNWGDNYVIVRVQISQQQFTANVAAIA